MTRTVHVFDRTMHEAHDWVNELSGRLGWSSERDALRLLRTVLCTIRDHLPVNEMAQFSAQLPIMLRGMFFEGWQPKKTPVHERDITEFIRAIEEQVGEVLDYRGASDITAVFDLINARISRGEVNDVRANLPRDLKEMWPAP